MNALIWPFFDPLLTRASEDSLWARDDSRCKTPTDTVAFIDILEAWRDQGKESDLKEALQGKMVIILNTETGYDLKPVPLESDYPGGGIHASTLNTILTGRFLKEVGPSSSFGIVLLLTVATTTLSIGRRGWLSLIVVFLSLFITLIAAVLLFSKGIIFPVLFPLIAIPLTYMTTLLYQNMLSRQHLINLGQEKKKIGADLYKVSQSLEDNRKELHAKRLTLSETILEMRGETNLKREGLQQILLLQAELEEADESGKRLLKEKRVLQKKI